MQKALEITAVRRKMYYKVGFGSASLRLGTVSAPSQVRVSQQRGCGACLFVARPCSERFRDSRGSAPALKFLGKQLVHASASLDGQSNQITSPNSIVAFW